MTWIKCLLGHLCFFIVIFSSGANSLDVQELKSKIQAKEKLLMIDIRSVERYRMAHIPNSINIPAAVLNRKRIPFLGDVVIYGDGVNVGVTKDAFDYVALKPGLSAYILDGGYPAWSALESVVFSQKGLSVSQEMDLSYQRLVELSKNEVRPILIDLRMAEVKESLVDHFPLNKVFSVNKNSQNLIVDIVAKCPKDNKQLLVIIGNDPSFSNQVANKLHAAGVTLLAVLVGGEHAFTEPKDAETSKSALSERSLGE